MGVGTPSNIIEAVWRGIDFFDCVLPARNARHGHLYTKNGRINLNNAKYQTDDTPVDEACGCSVCQRYSRAYLRHLLKAEEVLGLRLCVLHNLWFYNHLMADIRQALDQGRFAAFREEWSARLDLRI
jgi:queuine tRNA-ribosyltransferase